MKIIDEMKQEWRRRKLQTGFFLIALAISILSFLKPNYTKSIWGYLGITSLNLAILGILLFAFWFFYWRKK